MARYPTAHVRERTRRLLGAIYREEFRSAAYRVYRSATPEAIVDLEAETGETLFEDAEAFADGQTWDYLVEAVDACGNEGP